MAKSKALYLNEVSDKDIIEDIVKHRQGTESWQTTFRRLWRQRRDQNKKAQE